MNPFKAKSEMTEIDILKNQERELTIRIARLRRDVWKRDKVISYLLRRPILESGSVEMWEGDKMCDELGVRPWEK